MFYSAQILSKKGPLGSVWIASWSQRGLKRNEVLNCSLPAAVDSIINPEAPLALRLSGQLLLGLVRLYLRRLQFLEEDAGLALRGLARNAAAGGGQTVDLPDGGVAPEMAITLQDAIGGGYDPMAQFVGAELFPNFESSLFGPDGGGLGGGSTGELAGLGGGSSIGGGAASLTVAQDISELFGSHWTAPGEDERFEVDGDAMERRFSMELERLRSQGVEAPRDRTDMFFGGGQDDPLSPVMMDDEVMAVPPEDMFAGPAPTPRTTPGAAGGKTLLSVAAAAAGTGGAPLPGLSHMRITPPTLPGAADMLPDVGGGATGATSAGTFGGGSFSLGVDDELEPVPMAALPGEEAEQEQQGAAQQAAGAAAGEPARRRRTAAAGTRRRRAQVDAGADGRPATTLPTEDIRRLLADRKPLMTARGLRARRQPAPLPPRMFDVVAQSEAARDSDLYRPNAFASLAPELLELYRRAMTLPGQDAGVAGGATPGTAQRRRRSSRGTVAAEEEAAAAAAAAAEVAAEDEQAAAAAAGGEPLASPAAATLPAASGGLPAGAGGSMFSGGGGGAASDFGPQSAGPGGWDEDYVEHPDDMQQQEQQEAAAAALFPAGPEEEEGEGEGAEAARPGRIAASAAERRGRLPLQPVPSTGELGSTGMDSGSEGGGSGNASAARRQPSSFTKNTAMVLEHLRREFAPATGSKRRHPSQGDVAAGMAALSLDGLLGQPAGSSGAPRGRLDAARWFYEALVLRKEGFVTLQQHEPYGDIEILPTPLLVGGAAPPASAPAVP